MPQRRSYYAAHHDDENPWKQKKEEGQFDDADEEAAADDAKAKAQRNAAALHARLTGGKYPYNNTAVVVGTGDDELEEEYHYPPTDTVYDREGAARQMLMRSIEDGEEPPDGGFYEPDGRLIPLTSPSQIRKRWNKWLQEEKDIDKIGFSEPHPLPYGFERGPKRYYYSAEAFTKLPKVSYPPASASFDHQEDNTPPKKKKGFVDLTTLRDNTNSSDDDTSSPLAKTTTKSSKKKAKKQFAYADRVTSSSPAHKKGEEEDPYALKIDKKYHIKPMSDGHYFKNQADREDRFDAARLMPRDDDMPAMTKQEEEELYWNLQDYFYDSKKTMRDPTSTSSYSSPT